MITIWLNDTSAGSLMQSYITSETMKHIPRKGDIVSMDGKRYHVKSVIHEETIRGGAWRVHVIVGNMEQ